MYSWASLLSRLRAGSRSRSTGCPVKHIIFSRCSPSSRDILRQFRLWSAPIGSRSGLICPRWAVYCLIGEKLNWFFLLRQICSILLWFWCPGLCIHKFYDSSGVSSLRYSGILVSSSTCRTASCCPTSLSLSMWRFISAFRPISFCINFSCISFGASFP